MTNTYIINVEELPISEDYINVDPLSLGRTKRYISSDEIVDNMIVEIDQLITEKIEAKQGEEKTEQIKLVLHFKQKIKPLVLNQTNISNLRIVTGTDKKDLFDMSKIINNGNFLVKLIVQNGVRFGKNSNMKGVRISIIDSQESLIEQKYGKLVSQEQLQEIEHLMLTTGVTLEQIQPYYPNIKQLSELKESEANTLINKLNKTLETQKNN